MEDEAGAEPAARPIETAPTTEPVDTRQPIARAPTSSVRAHERWLRRRMRSHDRVPGPIIGITQGWVSRDAGMHVFAARYLDFAVLTDEHLDLLLDRLLHPPPAPPCVPRAAQRARRGPAGARARRILRIVGDFSTPLLFELRTRPGRHSRSRASSSSARGSADPPRPAVEAPTVTVRHRDRRRHDRRAHLRGRRRTDGRAPARYREFPQHFPQPGWVEHDADDIWRVTRRDARRGRRRARRRRRDRRRRSASPTSARRSWCGTAAPAGPGTARSSGRTAAPRPRCDELRAAGHEPHDPPRDRARARPVLLRDEARVAARTRAASPATPTSRSAPSTPGSSGTSPAAPTAACTRPTRRTRAARCSTTSAPARGPTSCAALFDVPRACLPDGRAVERALRR